jgi:uncharacterized coiled-coil protein SlyX
MIIQIFTNSKVKEMAMSLEIKEARIKTLKAIIANQTEMIGLLEDRILKNTMTMVKTKQQVQQMQHVGS